MPLALVGFALQSVPLKGSAGLSSSPDSSFTARVDTICQCRRVDKWRVGCNESENPYDPTQTP